MAIGEVLFLCSPDSRFFVRPVAIGLQKKRRPDMVETGLCLRDFLAAEGLDCWPRTTGTGSLAPGLQ
jgi:hypothetical protein